MTSRFKKILSILLIGLYLFPFGYLLLLSVSRSWRFPALWPDNVTLSNWSDLLAGQGELAGSLLVSVIISISVAVFSTLFGFATSKFIAYSKYRKQLMLYSYFPFVLSPVIYAACIYYFFIILDLSGSVPGVMIAQLIIAYPYAVIIFSGFWSDRIKSMEHLVAGLGGKKWDTYVRVLFPAARDMLLICFFQTFLISWFEYGLTSLIGVGKVQTLTIKVFQFIQEANIYHAALASCLLIFPPVLFLLFNKKYIFKTKA
ncbi:MAG: ABC transporter permease subunit [Balneolaceae bacterium]|nr:ABC transporter permease subunit [Balneolaceae bacterium]